MNARTGGAVWLVGLVAATSIVVIGWALVWGSVSPPAGSRSQIPTAASATVSGVLGAQQPAYQIASRRRDLSARTDQMAEQFGPGGLTLEYRSFRLGVTLLGWGRADRLHRPMSAVPIARENRVSYRYPGAEQWFVNGPLGVEQGFTIAHAPAGRGRLTIALGVGGAIGVSGESRSGLTLVGPDGVSLSYSGLTARDAAGRVLPATLIATRRRIIISVADRGARYPIVVDPFIEVAKLVDPNGEAESHLGDSLAMAGNTIVAAEAADASDTYPTRIDVFVEPSSGWGASGALVATLAAGTQADGLGSIPGSLSISSDGSVVVVGAPETNVGANAEQGVAYVFQRPPGGWSGALEPSATLKSSAGSAGDRFGASVAVSTDGKTAVIGVPQDGPGGSANGEVDVYARGAAWSSASTPSAVLTDSSLSGAELGAAVGTGGSAIAGTAPNANGTTGQTDVFVQTGSGWQSTSSPSADLIPDGSTSTDDFGKDLAMSSSGGLIAVGAPDHDQEQGAVYVYQLAGSAWAGHVSQSATLSGPAGTAGGTGGALAISGTTVLAGASSATIDNLSTAGAGYVYAEPASGWQTTSSPDATLSGSDPGIGSGVGYSVAMSGGIAVLGAPTATVNGVTHRGALYVVGSQPVTKISVSPASPNGLAGWYTQPVTFSVSASDAFSSLTATNCVLDPVTAPNTFAIIPLGCPYTGPGAAVSADGTHTLYAASDNADGTAEPARSVTVKIDRTPPSLTCAGDPTFRLGSSGGLVTATVKDTGSGAGAAVVTGAASTAKFGKQSAVLTGADVAGNTATARCPYSVTAPALNPTPTTKYSFRAAKRYTIIANLHVSSIPGAASLRVLCSGHGCPFAARSLKRPLVAKCTGKGKHRTCKRVSPKTYSVSITALGAQHLKPRATLTVEISQPRHVGKAYVFTMRAGKQPTHRITCLAPGSTKAGTACA
jgi:hypothetical protein